MKDFLSSKEASLAYLDSLAEAYPAYVKLYEQKPKRWVETEEGTKFFFDHLDGAYSFCLDPKGNVCHYSASTPVRLCNAPE